MKKLIATAMILTISMTSAFSATAFAQEVTQTTQRTIEVNGKGIVTAKPDIASIYFTVETKETTAEKAQTKNAEVTEQVTKALKELGVREDAIITQYYSIDVDQNYNEEKQKWEENGYRAYNRFMVKTNDVNNTGKYIDAAIKAGVTNVGSVSFAISDPNQYYKQALQSAVKNASSSAASLAESLGVNLGSCISVQEMASYNSYEKEEGVEVAATMAQDTGNMKARAAGANIKYQNIEISASVVMKYAY